MAQRRDSAAARKRILSSCVKLFIEKGYANTTMAEIVREADVSNSTFQNIFHSKSGALMDLVEFMFVNQFRNARRMIPEGASPALTYALETSIQMALVEANENLREIYVEAYTFPQTAEYIFQQTSSEIYKIFSPYMPQCSESDFYELEIGTAGIMRSYMVKPCDKYFTLEKKIARFLSMTLDIYGVPKEEREKIIGYITTADIRGLVNRVMQDLFTELAMKFDFRFDEGAWVEEKPAEEVSV